MKMTSSARAIQSRGPRTVCQARCTLEAASRGYPRSPPFTSRLSSPSGGLWARLPVRCEQRLRLVGHGGIVRLRAMPAGVEKRGGEDDHDEAKRQPARHLEVDHVDRVEVLDEQLEADPRDDDESTVDERGVA